MDSQKIVNSIDLIALIIQIIATVFMFFNSPINKPSIAFSYPSVDMKTPQKRNQRLRLGFLLLCIGFILQLSSLIIKGNC